MNLFKTSKTSSRTYSKPVKPVVKRKYSLSENETQEAQNIGKVEFV